MDDYYKVLGVEKTATAEEIRRAYHRMAHKYHPDKSSGDEESFKKVNTAYQVLKDPKKRSQYDQYGQTFDGNQGYGPFSGGESYNFKSKKTQPSSFGLISYSLAVRGSAELAACTNVKFVL